LGFNGDLYPSAGASVVMTTSGDMVKYQSGARTRLGIGSANQLLQVKSSLPSWETVDLADTVLTTAGDVLFENNTPELARLPKGTDADVLTLASGLPSWSAPAGGGAWTFIETITQASDAETFDVNLSSAYTYADFDHLVMTYNLKSICAAAYIVGLQMRLANTGTVSSVQTTSYFDLATFNDNTVGLTKIFWSANAGIPLMSDTSIGGGINDDMSVNGQINFYNNKISDFGSQWLKPFFYQTSVNAFNSYQSGVGFHETTTNQAELTAFQFAFYNDDYTKPIGIYQVAAGSTVTFWGVANT